MAPETFRLLATTVLVLHLLLVGFVVLGLAAILVGNGLGWRWVNLPGWRWPHLAVMVVVTAEAWFGIVCPLTTLEQWLDRQARGAQASADTYPDGFIAGWISRLLYYDLPPWVFVVGYSLFALGVIAACIRFPPRSRQRAADRGRDDP